MRSKLSKKEIREAFRLMRLSSEQQRESYRKLIPLDADIEKTHLFIRATIGTEEKDSEVEVARLE